MNITKCVLFLSVLVFMRTIGTAQVPEDSLRYFFEDDNIAHPKAILKVNPFLLLQGDLPLFCELIITRTVTLEAAAGIQLPFFFIGQMKSDYFQSDPSGGFSLRLDPRFYTFKGDWGEGLFIGPIWRRRLYTFDPSAFVANNKIISSDYGVISGDQLHFKNRFTFDYNTGFGIRTVKLWDRTNEFYYDITVFVLFTVNLGFRI